MQKFYKPSRVAVIFVIMAILLTLYMTTLYKLQIYDTNAKENALLARDTSTQTVTLTADRGDILDRNGIVLVSTRPAYNVTLSYDTLRGRDDYNKILLDLIHTAVDNGVPYNDTFPVTTGAPFTYLSDMTDAQKSNLSAYLKYFKYFDMDSNISASDLIVKMKEHYGIDYTTNIADARLIIGIRYEMELRAVKSLNPYVFANDVGIDFLTLVKTKHLPGVNIETSAKRVYHTTYAAHILGYTAKMDSGEYTDKYKALGYAFNSIVGKDGAEKAFEQYLHGTDGSQVITKSDNGTVMDVNTTKEPSPGENVFLSIDIGLQAVCEDSLAARIDMINAGPDRTDEDRVTGGAVVVTDVNTGEVLASCSYPTYDLSNILNNYTDLMNNSSHPLFDRATMGTYLPGSTFKMVTALAGLRKGTITATTTINDTGVFTKYANVGFTASCWIYNQTGHGHGLENVVTALRDSCNFFFYTVGDNTGLPDINKAATDFGLGSKTGIELPESTGVLADKEWKAAHTKEPYWSSGDTVVTSIGQGYNAFTPIQLADYVATIANGGTRYALTILDNVRSADFSSVVQKPEPRVLGTIQEASYLRLLQQGMQEVASVGTASTVFGKYPVKVAAKTGTVQTGGTNAKLNNGIFVCYAPADNPQIAISLVVEKGTSGSNIMLIARDIMDYYFHSDVKISVATDNTILP
jgi:penicillin-binding protein 2